MTTVRNQLDDHKVLLLV